MNRLVSEQALQARNIFDPQMSRDVDSVVMGRQVSNAAIGRVNSNNHIDVYPNASPQLFNIQVRANASTPPLEPV